MGLTRRTLLSWKGSPLTPYLEGRRSSGFATAYTRPYTHRRGSGEIHGETRGVPLRLVMLLLVLVVVLPLLLLVLSPPSLSMPPDSVLDCPLLLPSEPRLLLGLRLRPWVELELMSWGAEVEGVPAICPPVCWQEDKRQKGNPQA